jgi:4-amino-4-deoxy-L-arabinose transferase-like glycosyltransferase
MTNENSTTETANSLSTVARVGWGALIVATLAVCFFSNLGAIGFVGPDEPRYAWIARDMAETGDWVTPRLYGKPWFEKPVLYYWMAGTSFKLFGVSEAAARLPSALCALFATLALAWLAWRVYGGETARWLLVLLPTSVGMIGFSHAAATDMPFSAMVTIAMVCAAVVLGLARNENTAIVPRTPWLAQLLFGFFLGLAVLAKGPAGIILCGGAVFFWAIFTKRWQDAFRLLHPASILSFCATALPWYILCARRNPDFFRVFLIEHNFKRYLTPEFQHIQPFWYYGPVLLVAFLPWAIPLVWVVVAKRAGITKEGRSEHLQLLFWLGAIFCFLFFSASKSKLPGYVLPAILLIGFLFAREFSLLVNTNRKLLCWLSIGGAAPFMGAVFVFGFVLHRPTAALQAQADGIAAVCAFFSLPLLLIWCHFRGKPKTTDSLRSQMFCAATYCVALLLLRFPLALIDRDVSSRYLATVVSERKIVPIGQIRSYHLQRARNYQISFYFHQELKEFDLAENNVRGVITSLSGAAELIRSGVRLGRHIYGGGLKNEASFDEILPSNSTDGPAGGGQVRQEK